MNPSLTKYMFGANEKGHTLTELLFASAIIVMLIASVLGCEIFANRIYQNNVIRENLQRDAAIAMNKIIKGGYETSNSAVGIVRLHEALTYSFTKHVPPLASETLANPYVNPFIYFNILLDTVKNPYDRWFCLNNTSTSIIYHHPSGSGTMDEVIYTAPAGATIILQFSVVSPFTMLYPGFGSPVDNNVYQNVSIGIYVQIKQKVQDNYIFGQESAFINIRNHAENI